MTAHRPDPGFLLRAARYGGPWEAGYYEHRFLSVPRVCSSTLQGGLRLALPSDVPVDVIVRSPEKIRERLRMNDFFVREIMEKGLVLYASGNKRMA